MESDTEEKSELLFFKANCRNECNFHGSLGDFCTKVSRRKKGRKMIIFHKRGQKNHLFSVKKTMNDSFFCGLKLFLILSFDVI